MSEYAACVPKGTHLYYGDRSNKIVTGNYPVLSGLPSSPIVQPCSLACVGQAEALEEDVIWASVTATTHSLASVYCTCQRDKQALPDFFHYGFLGQIGPGIFNRQ